MPLPDKAIKEFQTIYEKKFKEKLTFEQAKIKAENFMDLFILITKPSKKSL